MNSPHVPPRSEIVGSALTSKEDTVCNDASRCRLLEKRGRHSYRNLSSSSQVGGMRLSIVYFSTHRTKWTLNHVHLMIFAYWGQFLIRRNTKLLRLIVCKRVHIPLKNAGPTPKRDAESPSTNVLLTYFEHAGESSLVYLPIFWSAVHGDTSSRPPRDQRVD